MQDAVVYHISTRSSMDFFFNVEMYTYSHTRVCICIYDSVYIYTRTYVCMFCCTIFTYAVDQNPYGEAQILVVVQVVT